MDYFDIDKEAHMRTKKNEMVECSEVGLGTTRLARTSFDLLAIIREC